MRSLFLALVLLLVAPRAHAQWQLDFIGVPAVLPELFSDLESLYDNGTAFMQIGYTGAGPAQAYLSYVMVSDNGSIRGVSTSEVQRALQQASGLGLPTTRVLAYGFGATPLSFAGPGVQTPTMSQLDGLVGWTHVRDEPLVLALLQAGALPEGTHSFYVWLSTEPRGAGQLLAEFGLSRTVITPGIPELLAPTDGATVREALPSFSWIAPALPAGVVDVSYLFRLVEMLGNQTPVDALRGNRAHFETTVQGVTGLSYPPSALPLVHGRRYAWQITTLRNGRPFGRVPNSGIFSFTYTDPNAEGSLTLVAPQGTPFAMLRANDNTRFTFSLDPAFDPAVTPWQDVELEIVRIWDPTIDVGAWVSSLDGSGFDNAMLAGGLSRAAHRVPVLLQPGGRQEADFTVPEENGFDQALAWRFRGRLGGRPFVSPFRVAIVQSNLPPQIEAQTTSATLLTGGALSLNYATTPEAAWNRVRVQILQQPVPEGTSAEDVARQLEENFAAIAGSSRQQQDRGATLREVEVPVSATGLSTLTFEAGAQDLAFAYRIVGTPRRGRDVASERVGSGFVEGTAAQTPVNVALTGRVTLGGIGIAFAPRMTVQRFAANGTPIGERITLPVNQAGDVNAELTYTVRTAPTEDRPVTLEIEVEEGELNLGGTFRFVVRGPEFVQIDLVSKTVEIPMQGVVLDTGDDPVVGAEVTVRLQHPGLEAVGMGVATVQTGTDGRFEAQIPIPSSYFRILSTIPFVASVSPGVGNPHLVQETVSTPRIPFGSRPMDLVIRMPQRPGRLLVPITAGGVAQANVTVQLFRGNQLAGTAQTDASGVAAFTVNRGAYRAVVVDRRFESTSGENAWEGTVEVQSGEENRLQPIALTMRTRTVMVALSGSVSPNVPARLYVMEPGLTSTFEAWAGSNPASATWDGPVFYTASFTQVGRPSITLPAFTATGRSTSEMPLAWVVHSPELERPFIQIAQNQVASIHVAPPRREISVQAVEQGTRTPVGALRVTVVLNNGQTLAADGSGTVVVRNVPQGQGGRVLVTSRMPGFGTAEFTFDPIPPNRTVSLNAELALLDGALAGCVVDRNGARVANANVSIPSRTVRTGADGCFQMNQLRPVANATMVISKDGGQFATFSRSVNVRAGQNDNLGSLTLPPFTGTLEVRVLSDRNAPLNGMNVAFVGAGRVDRGQNGVYFVRDVQRGTATLTITPPANTTLFPHTQQVNFNPALGQTTQVVTVYLQEGMMVSGTVVNRRNRQPVQGARVRSSHDPNGVQAVTTDAQGRYMLVLRPVRTNPSAPLLTHDVIVEHQAFQSRSLISTFAQGERRQGVQISVGEFNITTLHGFPIRVTRQQPQGERVLISGELLPGNAQTHLRWTSIPFNNVPLDANGTPPATVTLAVSDLPVQFAGHAARLKNGGGLVLSSRNGVGQVGGTIEIAARTFHNGTMEILRIPTNCDTGLCLRSQSQQGNVAFTFTGQPRGTFGPERGPHGGSGRRTIVAQRGEIQNGVLILHGTVSHGNVALNMTGMRYTNTALTAPAQVNPPPATTINTFTLQPTQQVTLLDNGLLRQSGTRMDVARLGPDGQALSIAVQSAELTPQAGLHTVSFAPNQTLQLMGQAYTTTSLSYSHQDGGTIHSRGSYRLPNPVNLTVALDNARFIQHGGVHTPVQSFLNMSVLGATLGHFGVELIAPQNNQGGRIRLTGSFSLALPGIPQGHTAFVLTRQGGNWNFSMEELVRNNFWIGNIYVTDMRFRYSGGQFGASVRMHPGPLPLYIIEGVLNYQNAQNWNISLTGTDRLPVPVPGFSMSIPSGWVERRNGDWTLRAENVSIAFNHPSRPEFTGGFEFGNRAFHLWIGGELTLYEGRVNAGRGDLWINIGERRAFGSVVTNNMLNGTPLANVVQVRQTFSFALNWHDRGLHAFQGGGQTEFNMFGLPVSRSYFIFGINAYPFGDAGLNFIRENLPGHPSASEVLNGFYLGMRTDRGGSLCCGLRASFTTSAYLMLSLNGQVRGQVHGRAHASLDWRILTLSGTANVLGWVDYRPPTNISFNADGSVYLRGCINLWFTRICAPFTIYANMRYANNSFNFSLSR